jgi:hypothetical protein
MNKELIEAIKSLRPTAEFSFTGDDYSTVKFDVLEGKAPTINEIEAEIVKMNAAKEADKVAKATAKAALLERLGITTDEAALLLS